MANTVADVADLPPDLPSFVGGEDVPSEEEKRKTGFTPGAFDSALQLRHGARFTKSSVAKALRASNGLVAATARRLGCSTKTVRKYLKKYPDLQEELVEIRESYIDLAESSLLKQIQEKNTAATIFLLKCLGKKRGYIESPNVQLHAHVEAGSGTWVDIMKRVATEYGGTIKPTKEEIARVIDINPEPPQLQSASACGSTTETTDGEDQSS